MAAREGVPGAQGAGELSEVSPQCHSRAAAAAGWRAEQESPHFTQRKAYGSPRAAAPDSCLEVLIYNH